MVGELVSYEEGFDQDSMQALIHWITSMREYAPDMIPSGWTDAQIKHVYFAVFFLLILNS